MVLVLNDRERGRGSRLLSSASALAVAGGKIGSEIVQHRSLLSYFRNTGGGTHVFFGATAKNFSLALTSSFAQVYDGEKYRRRNLRVPQE